MALISVLSIIIGFVLSVYAGVVLSLSGKMQTSSGELNHSKIKLFTIIMTISVLLMIGGTLGYYVPAHNLPYYFK